MLLVSKKKLDGALNAKTVAMFIASALLVYVVSKSIDLTTSVEEVKKVCEEKYK